MQAPLIDPRDRDQIAADTETAVQLYSPWRPPPGTAVDPGRALVAVFARFAGLVVDRLNRAPEKNYLAYLDLLGITQTPPRPAVVPLTFTVAAGAVVAPVVPAGTRVGGPPLPGETGDGAQEVVFETESPLVCTTSSLVAAWVEDTVSDTAADRTAAATGAVDAPFGVFTDADMPPTPHELYLACDPLFTTAAQTAAVAARTAAQAAADALVVAADAARAEVVKATSTAMRAAAAAGTATGIAAGSQRVAVDAPDDAAAQTRATADAAAAERAGGTADDAAAAVVTAELDAARAESAAAAAVAAVPPPPDPGADTGPVTPLVVRVHIAVPDLHQWTSWPVSWAWWDGARWADATQVDVVPAGLGTGPGEWQVTLAGVAPHPVAVGGITARWLRARLGIPLPPPETGIAPDALAIGARNPQYPVLPVAPLDVSPRRFYIASDQAFTAGGAVARLRVQLSRAGVALAGLRLNWYRQTATGWTSLGSSGPDVDPPDTGLRDETRGLTRDGTVTIPVPRDWPRTLYRTRVGRWLRIDLDTDSAVTYSTTPEIASLTFDICWDLPQIDRLTVESDGPERVPSACVTVNDFTAVDQSAAVRAPRRFTPFASTAAMDPALYLAFDRPFSPRPVALYLQVEPPQPEEVTLDTLAQHDIADPPHLVWEYSGPDGWCPLPVLDDTAAFAVRGVVRFLGPVDLTARRCFGRDGHWLRVRWAGGTFPLPPSLRRVLTNTVRGRQVTTVTDEILGSGTGGADRRFTTAQAPVQPGQRLVVREPERPSADEERLLRVDEGEDAVTVTVTPGLPDQVWVRWHAVPDLHGSGPRDRHYVLDAIAGTVAFGDGTAGMAPPPGQNNVRLTYRAGGGAAGNRPAGTLIELRSSIPSVDGVTNHEPAGGGAPVESTERLVARGPQVLRHRDRAVAGPDLQDLAAEASPDVARAIAIAPVFNSTTLWLDPGEDPTDAHRAVDAGAVVVVVVPHADFGTGRPTPGLGLLEEVRSFLQDRLPATARLWVAGPEWLTVEVRTTVVPVDPEQADSVADAVRAALVAWLHPLHGGPDGTGWAFGAWPRQSAAVALVHGVAGVDHVRELALTVRPDTEDPERAAKLQTLLNRPVRTAAADPDADVTGWLARALVCAGDQAVALAFPAAAADDARPA